MTMYTALAVLQAAVYTQLTTDAQFKALCRTYDCVPNDAVCPYITIGHCQELDCGTWEKRAWEVIITFHLWDASGSNATLYTLLGHLDRLFDQNHAALTLTSGTCVSAMRESAGEPLADPDGIHRQLPVKIRFRVQA